jgi:uncharacterized protein
MKVGARLAWVAALVLFAIVTAAALAQPKFPALSGRVVDQANVLSPATRATLTQLSEAHERETSNQVVVATIPSLQGYEIADFGVQLARAWKLGQADRNNGVLLFVAPNDRGVRIEVGYGLEGALPDGTAFRIIQDEILPRFRANDIDGGVLAGMRAILGAIDGTYKPKPVSSFLGIKPTEIIVLLFFLGAIVTIVIVERYQRARYPYRFLYGTGGGPWGQRPGFGLGSSDSDSSDSSSGGRRSSGGGSSGGSFGGGGGSFGGGGASGRW